MIQAQKHLQVSAASFLDFKTRVYFSIVLSPALNLRGKETPFLFSCKSKLWGPPGTTTSRNSPFRLRRSPRGQQQPAGSPTRPPPRPLSPARRVSALPAHASQLHAAEPDATQTGALPQAPLTPLQEVLGPQPAKLLETPKPP